jgi:hypothetical protein
MLHSQTESMFRKLNMSYEEDWKRFCELLVGVNL